MHVIRDSKDIKEGEGKVKGGEVRWGGVGGVREVKGEGGEGGRKAMGLCIQSTFSVRK